MKLEDIEAQWQMDSKIDIYDLSEASANSPHLHAKYSQILNAERRVLIAMERDFKRSKLAMRQFMINPAPNSNPKGFLSKTPKSQRILKSDFDHLIDGDEVITQEEAKLNLQRAKVEYLEGIMWQIKDRKDIIRNIISNRRLEQGD